MSFNDFNQVAVFCTEFTVSVSDTITSFDPGGELVMPQNEHSHHRRVRRSTAMFSKTARQPSVITHIYIYVYTDFLEIRMVPGKVFDKYILYIYV